MGPVLMSAVHHYRSPQPGVGDAGGEADTGAGLGPQNHSISPNKQDSSRLHSVRLYTNLCVCVCAQRSVLSDSTTPWAVARLAPLSVSFPGENTRVDCIVVKHGFNMLLQRKGPQRPGCPGPGKPHAAPAEGQMGTTGAHPGRTAPQTVGGPG